MGCIWAGARDGIIGLIRIARASRARIPIFLNAAIDSCTKMILKCPFIYSLSPDLSCIPKPKTLSTTCSILQHLLNSHAQSVFQTWPFHLRRDFSSRSMRSLDQSPRSNSSQYVGYFYAPSHSENSNWKIP